MIKLKGLAGLVTMLLTFALLAFIPSTANASVKTDVYGGGSGGAGGSCSSGKVVFSTKWNDYKKNTNAPGRAGCPGGGTTNPPGSVSQCNPDTALIFWLAFNDDSNDWFDPANGYYLDRFNNAINKAWDTFSPGSTAYQAAQWADDWANGSNNFGQNPGSRKHYVNNMTVICVTTDDVNSDTTCDDYFDYINAYTLERNGKNGREYQWVANPNKNKNSVVTKSPAKADSAKAYADCGIQCPTTSQKSSDPAKANYYVRPGREGDNVPAWINDGPAAEAGYNYTFSQDNENAGYYKADSKNDLNLTTDSSVGTRNRGYFCYYKGPKSETEFQYRIRDSDEQPLIGGSGWMDVYKWTRVNGEKVNNGPTEVVPGEDGSGAVTGEGAGPNKFVDDAGTVAERKPFFDIMSDTSTTVAQKKVLLAAEAAKSWTPEVTYDFKKASSARNLEALSEGGVVNVMLNKTSAQPVKIDQIPEKRQRDFGTAYLFDYTRTQVGTMTSGPFTNAWPDWVRDDSKPIVEKSYYNLDAGSTPNKWQVLTNHCNDTGFAAQTSSNATKIDSGDYTLSGTATSPVATDGSSRWSYTTGLRQSLFDKECAFDGTQKSGTTPDDGFVTMFRNNVPAEVKPNEFVPTTAGLVKYDGGDALTSSVTRWVQGTPNVAGLSNDGNFRLLADGTDIWSADTTATPTERNWSGLDAYARKTAGKVNGDPTWMAASNWASSSAQPEVLAYSWEYTPLVGIKVPTLVGYDSSGNKLSTNEEVVNAGSQSFTGASNGRIEGRVFSKNTGTSSPALKTLVRDNSGSGTTNSLDGNLTTFATLGWGTVKPNEFSGLYHVINFVRSTTE